MLGTSYHKKEKKKKDLELCRVKKKMEDSMDIKKQDGAMVIFNMRNF